VAHAARAPQLILLPKKPRIQRFWITPSRPAAASEAIEEAEWEQVDFNALTFNLAKPGVDYRNKRRAVVPITEKFAERLWSWKQRAEDNYVIGLSLRGKVTCTWKECKANLRAIGIDEPGVRATSRGTRSPRGCCRAGPRKASSRCRYSTWRSSSATP
jgi:hypothetical protein